MPPQPVDANKQNLEDPVSALTAKVEGLEVSLHSANEQVTSLQAELQRLSSEANNRITSLVRETGRAWDRDI